MVGDLEIALTERFGPPDSSLTSGRDSSYPVVALVHGDTSSAAAVALSAFHLRMPVAHVEAGLRTHTTWSPFPEELNRQLISRIAAFHLAPTSKSEENLVREGIAYLEVFVTGNTAIDAVQWASTLRAPWEVPQLEQLDEFDGPLVVITAHRRENWGGGIDRIGRAVATLADRYPDARFVLPLHPNPQVAGPLGAALENHPNVILTPPLGYVTFARLLKRARFAISDSGGIQEEAPAVGTPVLVCRETTERGEAVDAGTVRLVGTDVDTIVAAGSALFDDDELHERMATARNPFGDGRAAERIVRALEHLAFGTEKPTRFGSGYDREVVLRAAGFSDGLIEAARARPGRGLVKAPPPNPIEPPVIGVAR